MRRGLTGAPGRRTAARRRPPRRRDTAAAPVLFAHILAISPDARHRFNIGPLTRVKNAPPFSLTFDEADWDRSTAMNAPGQSESAGGAHFSDLARLWITGGSVPLSFSDRAVTESAESTLTLTRGR